MHDYSKVAKESMFEYMVKESQTTEEDFFRAIVDKINKFEAELTKLTSENEDAKRKELDRINNEFLVHDYERRFNCSLYQVINVIVGSEQAPMEYSRQKKKQLVLR